MEFVAVDIGTSFTKGAVVNVESLQIQSVTRRPAAARLPSSNPLVYELDPNEVVTSVREIISELLKQSPACQGILMCGQMGGLILCTDQGTTPRPYISWLDQRATQRHPTRDDSILQVLAEALGDRITSTLGKEFRPGLPITILYALKAAGDLPTNQHLIPVTLPDFVSAALCQVRPVMEHTTGTGTLDISDLSFPGEMLSELGIEGLDWPEVVGFRHCVGEYESHGRSIPVYAPTGDHQCSLVGTLLSEHELSINVSTGSQVSMLANNADSGDYQIRPFFDGHWLRTITNIPAGRALTAIMKLLTELGGDAIDEKQAWEEFFDKSESTPHSDVNASLAFFPGAVAGPGHFANLREDNLTVGHLARASLERMAKDYREFALRLSPKKVWQQLVFSGGIAQRSSLLRELTATGLNSPFRVASSTEDALFGLLMLGRVIAGLEVNVASAALSLREKLSTN